MQFLIDDVFAGIEKTVKYMPVESFSLRHRFGEHKSIFRDQGRDFYQLRKYDPETDSLGDIVWSSREADGSVYVREARISKEFTGVVLADLSASIAFSAGYPYKMRMLLETIGNFGMTCFHGQDPLGLIGFADEVVFDEQPRVGQDQIYYILEHLYDYFNDMIRHRQPVYKKKGTDFAKAFNFFAQRYAGQNCFVVVISDFMDAYEIVKSSALKDLNSQHEIIFVFLDDVSEFQIKNLFGYARIADIETGQSRVISLRKLKNLQKKLRIERKLFRDELRQNDIESVVLEYGKHFERFYRFLLTRQEILRV